MDSLSLIFLLGCCFVGVMGIAVIAAVTISRRREGQKAQRTPGQLAEQMGLTPLDLQHPHRFGGKHRYHTFYIDQGITGSVSSRSISLGKTIAVSLDVQMKEPKKGYAYCNRGRVSPSTSFDSAFRAKLQHEWISAPAREAMLAFVRTRENLFLEGLPIQLKPQTEQEAKVRLRHNFPNNTQITPEQVRAVLDELVEVAHVIETTC